MPNENIATDCVKRREFRPHAIFWYLLHRDESAAEKDLKAEVQALTKQLKAATANGGEVPDGGPSIVELEQQLDAKERALLKLQAEEDDKVRFARGSRAGAEVGKERLQRNDGDGAGKDSGAPPPRRERW